MIDKIVTLFLHAKITVQTKIKFPKGKVSLKEKIIFIINVIVGHTFMPDLVIWFFVKRPYKNKGYHFLGIGSSFSVFDNSFGDKNAVLKVYRGYLPLEKAFDRLNSDLNYILGKTDFAVANTNYYWGKHPLTSKKTILCNQDKLIIAKRAVPSAKEIEQIAQMTKDGVLLDIIGGDNYVETTDGKKIVIDPELIHQDDLVHAVFFEQSIKEIQKQTE